MTNEQPTEKLSASEYAYGPDAAGASYGGAADPVLVGGSGAGAPVAHAAPARARRMRLHTPKSGLVLLPIALVAMIVLAFVAWGGMFAPGQLALVILGSVLFSVAGLVALWRSRSLVTAVVGWIVGLVLLFSPLLVGVAAQEAGQGDLAQSLIFAGIGLWISGVAAVALLTSVLCLILHSRSYR